MDTMISLDHASGNFVNLMQSISLAGRMISARVNKAGLSGMFGATGEVNVQGEFVQKLDEYANRTFISALEHGGHTCMIVSEEEDGPVPVPNNFHSGRYIVTVDPLDGSSNIDCNATIGTIFAIFRRNSEEGQPADPKEALQSGRDLVASGYIVYGAGTVLVFGNEFGVHGFTLDPTVGEFFLSHPNMRIPKNGRIYSCNEAYAEQWQPGMRTYINGLKAPEKGYRARYIGSLVADFHRTLLKGGIFLYPATPKSPSGKLRLLYEGFPLAHLAELAGGAATDGRRPILDIMPSALHVRTSLIIGEAEAVAEATALISKDPLLN
jgi:fructose-1,6-bisphosphatase I